MLKEDNLDFHPKYVNPFYLGLMGFNFINNDIIDDPDTFLTTVRLLEKELTHYEILLLLNGNWRPSKVGAWIIGLNQLSELEYALIEYLKNNTFHSEHVIISLSLFNSKKGNEAIQTFVESQLNTVILTSKNKKEYPHKGYMLIDELEKTSCIYGLAVLHFLDTKNNTPHFKNLTKTKSWLSLMDILKPYESKNLDILSIIKNQYTLLEKAMDIILKQTSIL